MYILPESVKRRLLRRYRRRSRQIATDERFRGWAWEVPPIDPPYEYYLSLSEISSRYCQTMRDIYLRHVEKKRKPTTAKMIEGKLYHEVASSVVEHAKRILYSDGKMPGGELFRRLEEIRSDVITDATSGLRPPEIQVPNRVWDLSRITRNMVSLWDYQANQIAASLDRVLSTQPYAGIDAIVNLAIPVVVEQKLDGRNLGLSGYLSADAYGVEGIVFDIKTGIQRRFHRLATTGYAMVIESIYEYPVDVGCIVYCWFGDDSRPSIKYDVHVLDEYLRQEFLEVRDTAMKLIFDERDPGLPAKCYEDCPYWEICH